MKAIVPLTTLALLASVPIAAAQTAGEIIEKHTTETAAALESYLEKNPEASDQTEAIDFLVEAYQRLEQPEKVAGLLARKYLSIPKGADLDPQEFFMTVQPLFEAYSAAGEKDKARKLLETAKTDIEGHPQAARFAQFLDQMGGSLNQPGVGDTMDLAFTSLSGEKFDLADHKGKVVLVDFWATWCGPCIAELPTVKQAYDKYHDKGFEIVGISLDQDKGALETFIEEKEMPWPQAFDGKGWQNEIAVKFGIQSIPATFLIGKDGKVVATDLRGPALGEAVAKHLGL